MQAWEIPSILEDCLLFPIEVKERDIFEEIRALRNAVAHGRAPVIPLAKSLQYSSKLHKIAARVDNHIVEHFLVTLFPNVRRADRCHAIEELLCHAAADRSVWRAQRVDQFRRSPSESDAMKALAIPGGHDPERRIAQRRRFF